jgi:hypothetical protein
MSVRNQHWYNLNEGRRYPLDDKATALSDSGDMLPSNIITDIRLRWPRLAGQYAFVSAVTVTPGAVSVTIQAADSLDNPNQVHTPVAVISVPIQDMEEGRQFRLEAQYPETFGYITFGSGIQNDFVGRFGSPAQTLLAPRAARHHDGLPVKSLGKLYNATALTGVVQLLGTEPVEVVKESREILGVERDVIVIRLVDDPTAGQTGQAEESVFSQYAGPCAKRPESDTCGEPTPIEFINAVAPDCDGVICLDFDGVSVVGRNTDDCSIVVDLPFGLSEACVPPFLPDENGNLPSEVPPVNIVPPIPPEPPIPPDESISDSVIVVGELPYCDPFDDFTAASFVTKVGQFVFVADDSPNEICGAQTPGDWDVTEEKYPCSVSLDLLACSSQDSVPILPVDIDSSYASEGFFSASQRNVAIWQGFDVTTLYRAVTTDVKMMPGPPGARHNGGIAINYRPHATIGGVDVYYVAEVDYDTQEFKIQRWNGTTFQPAVSVTVPGILLESWYRIIVEIKPGVGDQVYITARLIGIDDPTVSVVLGPLLTTNYRPAEGHFGFATNRALTRFSFFHLDEHS